MKYKIAIIGFGLVAAATAQAGVHIGINIGHRPPPLRVIHHHPPVVIVHQPACPPPVVIVAPPCHTPTHVVHLRRGYEHPSHNMHGGAPRHGHASHAAPPHRPPPRRGGW